MFLVSPQTAGHILEEETRLLLENLSLSLCRRHQHPHGGCLSVHESTVTAAVSLSFGCCGWTGQIISFMSLVVMVIHFFLIWPVHDSVAKSLKK